MQRNTLVLLLAFTIVILLFCLFRRNERQAMTKDIKDMLTSSIGNMKKLLEIIQDDDRIKRVVEAVTAVQQKVANVLPKGFKLVKNVEWVGKSYHHVADQSFSKGLVILMKEMGLKSVVDLGCGQGQYINHLNMILGDETSLKKNFRGYNGNQKTSNWDVSGGLCVGGVDLSAPMNWEPADLAMSIEVGEHIPKEYEETFIDNIVKSAKKMIVLTWAAPGQGGEGHVNNQTPEYIANEIERRGKFLKSDELTQWLKKYSTVQWIKANLQVFVSS